MRKALKRGTCVRCGKLHGEKTEIYCLDCHTQTIRSLYRENMDIADRLVPIIGYWPPKR